MCNALCGKFHVEHYNKYCKKHVFNAEHIINKLQNRKQ